MNTKERTLIEVTEANFDAEVIKAKVPVIVHVYANWCIPCRIFKPFLARFADELGDGAKVFTVDAIANPGLSQLYRISAVPTLIVFRFIYVCRACHRSFRDESVNDVGAWIAANLDAEVQPNFMMEWDRRVRRYGLGMRQ